VDSTPKAAVAEFVATFALVFVGAGAVILGANGQLDLTGVALAQGLVLAIMVSITAHISGGMVNPAVAISLWVTGKVPSGRAGALIAAEVAGAGAAAFLLRFLLPSELFDAGAGGVPALADGFAWGKGILLEAVMTFFLVFAVFGTIVDDRGPYSKTAGLTVGLVIAFDIMAFGPYTGAAMNPARWFGPALATTNWANWYVWIVGPIAGGIVAGVLYWAVFLKDKEPATP
jgi:aquaporin Z